MAHSLQSGTALDPHRPIAFVHKRAKYLLGMGAVARLHGDVELGALGRYIEKQPVMIDPENIGAEFTEPAGNLAENTGAIGNGETERHDAVGPLQFAHHDGRENPRIDIAATQDQSDLAPGESF